MSDPYQRDFTAPQQPARRLRGAAASRRALEPTVVDWDTQIASLRRLLRLVYAKGAMEGPELEHLRSESQERGD